MCDNINMNIDDYTNSDLFALLSLSAELSTKSLIQQQALKLKKEFLDEDFHAFINNVEERLIRHIKKSCGFENNVINFGEEMKPSDEFSLINTNNNKYYERNIIEKVLIVDTKYRDNFLTETSTNFNIVLPNVVKNVISIQLSDIEFPNTWYPFDETQGNTFFHIKASSMSEWIRFDISSQAYYYQDLFDSVNKKLTLISNISSGEDSSYNSFEFVKTSLNLDLANAGGTPSGTGTISFTSVDSYIEDISNTLIERNNYTGTTNKVVVPYINYDLDFFSDNPNEFIYSGNDYGRCSKYLGWNLGFRNITPNFYSNEQNYTSESTIDLGGPRYLYLIIDDHNKYMNSAFIPFSRKMSSIKDTLNIFARISLQGAPFSLYNSNSFSVYSDIRKYNGLVDLSHLSIKLIDEYGTPLNLNNNDYSFTIKMNTIQTT